MGCGASAGDGYKENKSTEAKNWTWHLKKLHKNKDFLPARTIRGAYPSDERQNRRAARVEKKTEKDAKTE